MVQRKLVASSRMFWVLTLGVLLLFLSSPHVNAQGGTEILGTIHDSTGAVVPEAQVEIRNDQQGWTRTTVSSDLGSYSFSAVPVGAYTVKVQKPGFRGYTQTGVILQVDMHARVDVNLELGPSLQTVTVTGSAALLETTSSTNQNVIDRERIQDLPLNGRDTRQLISLVPGGVQKAPLDQFIASPSFSVNGAREDQVNFRLDGGEHMDTWFGSGLPYPNPDALQEFTVQTSNFSAKFGRNAGAIVDAVTRSGTNTLHGTLSNSSGIMFSTQDHISHAGSSLSSQSVWGNEPVVPLSFHIKVATNHSGSSRGRRCVNLDLLLSTLTQLSAQVSGRAS